MGSDLRRRAANGSAVHSAEFIVSSARLGELYECSALLRRTRMRAEEIVDEARMLLAEAERGGDADHILNVRTQLEQARIAYCKVLNAYVTLCRKINEERQAILQAQLEQDRRSGLSGVA
ncbi:hypothetical protein ACFLIM_38310 [Nonomuraea sp. M3C6]|uniref:Uncharacterized protein n=1 Tax=Nonomuraea marmarensis TaxID=3351344 RepID=A0ABW7ARN5_9ACTN